MMGFGYRLYPSYALRAVGKHKFSYSNGTLPGLQAWCKDNGRIKRSAVSPSSSSRRYTQMSQSPSFRHGLPESKLHGRI